MAGDRSDPLCCEADLIGPLPPLHFEVFEKTILFRVAGGEHRHLPRRRSVGKTLLLAPLLELVSATGEHIDLVAGEPFDVRHTVMYRLPPHPQPPG